MRILQAFEGSLSSDVVVVLLNSNMEAPGIHKFTMKGSAPDLESLINSPAFLKVKQVMCLMCKCTDM